ncbi:Uncharacterised protein [Mycobacteroides abscessus subsp. abscessus]|nr:Uncharacterised protein [Mycobacteroides abscessus subsp. abscessus]
MMVVICSRVVTPPSELSLSAFDSSSSPDLILSPLPSATPAAALMMSLTGPWPLPSPLSDTDNLSSMPSTRSNSTGVLVLSSPMVSPSWSVGPPR